MKRIDLPPLQGFTLLELLIIIVIIVLGSSWAIPQYQRRLALNQLDQYSQQIESGLFSLRARQSAEGTSCEININPSFVGIDNTASGFGQATDVLEFSHLNAKQREERLRCCDATSVHGSRLSPDQPGRNSHLENGRNQIIQGQLHTLTTRDEYRWQSTDHPGSIQQRQGRSQTAFADSLSQAVHSRSSPSRHMGGVAMSKAMTSL